MNTRAKDLLPWYQLPWYKKMFYRIFGTPFADPPLQLPPPKNYSHEQALRDMLHKGISIGIKQSAVIYTCFCERHHTPLHETLPGVFVCMLCQTGPMQPVQQSTDPLQPAHPQLLSYLEKKNPHPSIHTAEFRTVHLKKVRQG